MGTTWTSQKKTLGTARVLRKSLSRGPMLAVLGLVFQPALERFLSWITSKFGPPVVHQFAMLFS